MIIHLFRKSGRYGCNAMFKSSVHPRKNYIEKLRSSRKKRLLFTAKSVKSRLQYSQYVNSYKRCIRIEIHTLTKPANKCEQEVPFYFYRQTNLLQESLP